MNQLAQAISLLSSPVVLSAPIAFVLIYETSGDLNYSLLWMLVSLLFCSSVVMFVFWGVKRGMFSNMDISIRSERQPAFIFAGGVVTIYFFVILFFNGPKILLYSLATLFIGLILISFVNKKIKASMHLAVYSAFALLFALFFGGIFWILPFFAPAIAWSRLKLKRHKLPETIYGALIGSMLVIILYCIVKYIIVI